MRRGEIPSHIDDHLIERCLQTARGLKYRRGGNVTHARPAYDVSTLMPAKFRCVWPKVERALRDLLGIGKDVPLRKGTIEDFLFVHEPRRDARVFAEAVAALVLALRGT